MTDEEREKAEAGSRVEKPVESVQRVDLVDLATKVRENPHSFSWRKEWIQCNTLGGCKVAPGAQRTRNSHLGAAGDPVARAFGSSCIAAASQVRALRRSDIPVGCSIGARGGHVGTPSDPRSGG